MSLAWRDVEHDVWRQALFVDGQESPVATISWTFPEPKTLVQRLSNASRSGENVTWVIDPPCGTNAESTEGTWWFSNNAGFQRYGFDWEGSGSAFSADDGAWGAGTGPVNGNIRVPEDFTGQASRCAAQERRDSPQELRRMVPMSSDRALNRR